MSLVRHLLIIAATLLCTAGTARAQLQWSKWFFGYGATLDFATPTLFLIPGSALRTMEGSASIADRTTGDVLFYTDGKTVWNRLNRKMPSGVGLAGHLSSTQTALIVPDPGNRSRYYVFTADAYEDLHARNGSYDGICYSIVDMTLDSGRGDVVLKNQRLEPELAAEKLCGIRRCADDTYWVITHVADDIDFYAYHVTEAGISAPVISRTGSVHKIYSGQPPRISDLTGCIRSSTDGARIAVVQGAGGAEVFDFDQATGRIQLAMQLDPIDPHLYGVSFSPDGTRLYTLQNVAGGVLAQYDLTAGTAAQVSASRVVLAQYSTAGGSLQLAPDGRIYIAIESRDALDVIAEPNRRGTACRVLGGAVGLGGKLVGWGLPNIIESELGFTPRPLAGPDTVICPGDSVRLAVTGGASHRWSPAASLSCADCAAPIAHPETTTRYIVETRSAGGCVTSDTVVVTVHDAASIDAGDPRAICVGDTATLAVQGGVRWQWTPSTSLSCADCPAPRAFPARTTTYVVTAWSAGGCLAADSVRVVVNPIPRVVARGDTTVCPGTPVALRAEGAATYRWTPADGLSCSDCADPIATLTGTRVYRVEGTSSDGCVAADSVVVSITPAGVALAFVDTSLRVAIGTSITVPVLVDRADLIALESELQLDVRYDESILRLNSLSSIGTLAENGEAVLMAKDGGGLHFRIRPGPRRSDTLVALVFRSFLGAKVVSPIEIALRGSSPCLTISSRAGRLRLDSLCGLAVRQIMPAEPVALRPAMPNPFDGSTRIDYTVMSASHVRMRIFDAAGRERLRPIDTWLDEGRHTLELDGAALPPGLYTVVLEAEGTVVTATIARR